MKRVYSVIFKENGKGYLFKSKDVFEVNDYVIVETEKGLQIAKVNHCYQDKAIDETIKDIIRKATDEDYNNYLKNLKDAKEALKKCIGIVKELGLVMNIVDAQYNFDRTQLLFNFTADERIDFRELARRLAAIYHTRIELRQIGARDKAKEVGGIGVCGKRLCCNSFLNQIMPISMNMAKNQNLALNPTKINGLCGRLLCCLAYEDDMYIECSKGLPKVGDEIKTTIGCGIVDSVDILNRKCTVMIDGEKEEVKFEDSKK